jgi:hypothetical protein
MIPKKVLICFLIGFFTNLAVAQVMKPTEEKITGNTLIISNKYGPTFIYFEPSGRFYANGLNGPQGGGQWRATSDSICSTADPAPDGKIFPEFCMSIKEKKINDSWTAQDTQNGMIKFKLVKGKIDISQIRFDEEIIKRN